MVRLLSDAAAIRELKYQAHGATVILGALVLADVDRPGYGKRIVTAQGYRNLLMGANSTGGNGVARGAFDELYP